MRVIDLLLASLAILCCLPLFLLVGLLVLLCDGRPVFHRSERLGRDRVPFLHIKFRTMRPGGETGRVFFEQDRITRLGRFLRRTHLDELPELLLIFRGTMAFVGPRPLPAQVLEGLDDAARYAVRPGWTGPAQLSLLKRGSLNKYLQIRLDARYAARRSLSYDMRILLRTCCLVLHGGKRTDLDPAGSADRRRFGKTLAVCGRTDPVPRAKDVGS
jgi:lipopolysaccharide/colanic/teichoic acid biosynthesis glycosyltransferase